MRPLGPMRCVTWVSALISPAMSANKLTNWKNFRLRRWVAVLRVLSIDEKRRKRGV